MHGEEEGSVWRQPRAVWAVAFACVVAFMGLGVGAAAVIASIFVLFSGRAYLSKV